MCVAWRSLSIGKITYFYYTLYIHDLVHLGYEFSILRHSIKIVPLQNWDCKYRRMHRQKVNTQMEFHRNKYGKNKKKRQQSVKKVSTWSFLLLFVYLRTVASRLVVLKCPVACCVFLRFSLFYEYERNTVLHFFNIYYIIHTRTYCWRCRYVSVIVRLTAVHLSSNAERAAIYIYT